MGNNEQMLVPIDEMLHLPTDKKISEMMTISLDPDVEIIKKEAFYQLRGKVLLQGKYKKITDNHVGEVILQNKQYMKETEELHYHEVIFAHPFPVEITIAAYRITDLADVSVKVSQFDYEIIEPEKMHVKASLEITGLAKKEEKKVEQTGKKATKTSEMEKEQVLEETEQVEEVQEEMKDESIQHETVSEVGDLQVIDEREEVNEAIEVQAQDTQAVHIGQTEETGEELEHTLFLRQLFAEDEDVNEKVTLYITQAQDTIETIASRYNISTYQLMKENDLTEDLIEEGQILKIR